MPALRNILRLMTVALALSTIVGESKPPAAADPALARNSTTFSYRSLPGYSVPLVQILINGTQCGDLHHRHRIRLLGDYRRERP